MAIEPSLQAQVDAQLMEQGAFAPLELLFNSGRLLYSDYESWRRGELEFLDGVLMGNRERTRAEIEQAVGYARSIGLVEQPQEFFAWRTEGSTGSDKPLRTSADAGLQRLIGGRYIPAQNVPQMDLFFDNPVVALANGIVRALTSRDIADAQRQLDRLYAQAPNHSDLTAFDQLLVALGHLGHPGEDARQELEFLIEVTPTARRLLECAIQGPVVAVVAATRGDVGGRSVFAGRPYASPQLRPRPGAGLGRGRGQRAR